MSERGRLPPILLPEGDARDLWVIDGRFSDRPVEGAEALPGRYALPGLVDAHAHVALGPAKEALGVRDATLALRGRLDEGVLAVRDLGAPHSVTLSIESDPTLPTLQPAGRWLAPEGRFYPSFHQPVAAEALVTAALAEVAAGARWVKVIADWVPDQLNYDADLLRGLVDAVRARRRPGRGAHGGAVRLRRRGRGCRFGRARLVVDRRRHRCPRGAQRGEDANVVRAPRSASRRGSGRTHRSP